MKYEKSNGVEKPKRSNNADEFRDKYISIQPNYNTYYIPSIEKSCSNFDVSSISESLQAHFVEYLINSFLQALNWQLNANVDDKLPDFVRETFPNIRQAYGLLGTEGEERNDLLIIKIKHSKNLLPKRLSQIYAEDESVSSIIVAGIKGENLTDEWNEWLDDLRKEVEAVYDYTETLRRLIITNGYWLIIFINPKDTFLLNKYDLNNILVFSTGVDDTQIKEEKIIGAYNKVYACLEHQRVLNETFPLSIGRLSSYITSRNISRVMHGLRLIYTRKNSFKRSPIIDVMPIVFLRSYDGSWLRVDSGIDRSIPHEANSSGTESLKLHLEDVEEIAGNLLGQISRCLSTTLLPSTIESHNENDNYFRELKLVESVKGNKDCEEYIIVTGQRTHYLRLNQNVSQCLHHNWMYNNKTGCATARPILVQEIEPRSFFTSGEEHHCCHQQVEQAKSNQVMTRSQQLFGLSKKKDYSVFCKIWSFERYLCCRNCIFENVCTNETSFNNALPCQHFSGELYHLSKKTTQINKIRMESATKESFDNGKPKFALVMKGGGVKGLAYVGALEVLKEHYDFDWFIGTSAGAITAVLLGAGFSVEELKTLLYKKDFSEFFDAKWYQIILNVIYYKGIHEANTLTNWLDNLLAEKLGSPTRVIFPQLPYRVSTYACRHDRPADIIDSKSAKYETRSPASAARASMAIPLVFTPSKEDEMHWFDGGMRFNYPVEKLKILDPNKEFIGLYLGEKTFKGKAGRSIFSDIYSILVESNDIAALEKYQSSTIIINPDPITTLDFDLTKEEKDFLLMVGRAAALEFIYKQSKEGNLLKPPTEEAVKEAFSSAERLKAQLPKRGSTLSKVLSVLKINYMVVFLLSLIVVIIGFIIYTHYWK